MKTLEEGGLKGITSYSLRHTFLSYVMDRVGHRMLPISTRHLHVTAGKDSPVRKIRFK